MPVEMFPKLRGFFRVVDSAACQIEANAFRDGDASTEDWMGDESVFFWSTIRDLMLSGF